MNIRAEATIDLDEKRKVWSQAEALDVDPEDARDAARGVASAAAAAALDNFVKVAERRPDLVGVDPAKGKPDMPAFGDDDD